MPFIVECPYCKIRTSVPDRAMGASGKCPRCASYFTLTPAEDQRVPELVGSPTEPHSSELEPAAKGVSGAKSARADAESKCDVPEEPESDEAEGADDRLAPAAVAPVFEQPKRGGVATLPGAVALFVGGGALACTATTLLTWLVIPLACLGCIVGVVAIALSWQEKALRRVLPILGAGVSLFILGFAVFTPAILGPTYARYRQSGPTPSTSVLAIPLGGGAKPTPAPEWLDASAYAWQRGEIRVQVVSISVGMLPSALEAKEPPPEVYLLVRTRTIITARDLAKKNDPVEPTQSAKLTNLAGTACALKESKQIEPIVGKRRADPFPVQTLDEILAFEMPPTGWEELKLELPASKQRLTIRFTIPAKMLELPLDEKGARKLK